MGKREEYNQSSYYVDQCQAAPTDRMRRKNNKMGSPYMQRFSRNRTRGVRQLAAVPSWEKQFCLKIGLFKWKDFLDAKKYSQDYATSKIQNWDDSAAEKAFDHAKNRFFARFGGLQLPHTNGDDQSMMDPNLYIDEINWDDDDDEMDQDILEELESAKIPKDYHVPDDPDPIQIQEMKPTGWDIDAEELSQSNALTGLIVGDY